MTKRFLILIMLTAAACGSDKETKPREERIPVVVATAEQKSVPVRLRAIGTVQPFSTVAVRALVGGQLTKVWFREGQDVRRGDMLFTIDPRPLEATLAQARANLARDEAQLRNAESERKRYAELVTKDYVTREEFDKVSAAAEAARAVAAADRAAIDNAQLQLSYCQIHAPIDGRTGSLMVHAGNIVRANDTTPLVTINQIEPVYVQFSVPESQLGPVRAESPAGGIAVTATPQGTTQAVTGRLSFIDNAVDATTGTIALKATFDNKSRALWPGQFVTVGVDLSERPNATVVPSQAVQTGQRGQYVYVVNGDSVAMRPVVASEGTGGDSVIEKGLAPGETVVTDGQLRLTPKSKVEVRK